MTIVCSAPTAVWVSQKGDSINLLLHYYYYNAWCYYYDISDVQECHGEGESVDPKLRCKKCNGKKVNRERKILEVGRRVYQGGCEIFL